MLISEYFWKWSSENSEYLKSSFSNFFKSSPSIQWHLTHVPTKNSMVFSFWHVRPNLKWPMVPPPVLFSRPPPLEACIRKKKEKKEISKTLVVLFAIKCSKANFSSGGGLAVHSREKVHVSQGSKTLLPSHCQSNWKYFKLKKNINCHISSSLKAFSPDGPLRRRVMSSSPESST